MILSRTKNVFRCLQIEILSRNHLWHHEEGIINMKTFLSWKFYRPNWETIHASTENSENTFGWEPYAKNDDSCISQTRPQLKWMSCPGNSLADNRAAGVGYLPKFQGFLEYNIMIFLLFNCENTTTHNNNLVVTLSSCRTLQNVIQTQMCATCQLNKLSTPFPAAGGIILQLKYIQAYSLLQYYYKIMKMTIII